MAPLTEQEVENLRALCHRRWYQGPGAQLAAFLLLTVMFVVALYQIDGTVDDVKEEGVTREDQFCLLAERDHRQDVRSLRRTYNYIEGLTPEELTQPLNRTVVQFLPRTEAEAHNDAAPPLCDKPDRGLPEPDPKIPKRPAKVDELLGGNGG